jgi:acetyltransferase-like isoleucine patch superfamily enzyme
MNNIYFNPFYLVKIIIFKGLKTLPYFKFVNETRHTQTPITIENWFIQKILGINREAYWPVSRNSIVTGARNIFAGIETSPGSMPGCYIQAAHNGKIYIGDYTQIASNVGIIASNHLLTDNRKHIPSTIIIGKYCWLGFGCVILPGVKLGDYTIVGANSVVTKSFMEGYCVIAGNPAKIVKYLDREKCVKHKSKNEYNGFIPAYTFDSYRKKNLNVVSWDSLTME